jgi:ribosomal protein S18 acetylase RimI-like enzyme
MLKLSEMGHNKMKEVYVLKQSDEVCGFAYTVKDYLAEQADKNQRMVTSIFVARGKRGRGYGRILLAMICKDADTENVTLILGVDPNHDSPLQRRALVSFYKRYGFKRVKGNVMRRLPR